MHNVILKKGILFSALTTVFLVSSGLISGCNSQPKEVKKPDEIKKFVGTEPSTAERERRRVAEENAMKTAPVQSQIPTGPSASQAELRAKFGANKKP